MKTDNYKTLCLEQAARSPLRYRHGCIIVRGGKVIGQGFNDHRAGFSGGALKNGRLPVRSLDGAALAELKKTHKLKRDLRNPLEEKMTFTPFERMGGGTLANTPLSMHSEMMAIHSALSASSTMASSAVSSQKPYFKLSGDSKRKARLWRDAIKCYVETVCKAALAHGELKALHVNRATLRLLLESKKENDNVATLPENRMEKQRMKNRKYHHHEDNNQSKAQQHNKKRRQHGCKLSKQDFIAAPCYGIASDVSINTDSPSENLKKPPEPHSSTLCKKKQKRKSAAAPAQTQPMLLPKGSAGRGSRSIADRIKSPRLNGADLYVARLGWKNSDSDVTITCCDVIETPVVDTRTPKPSTGSLHDELLSPSPPSSPPPPPPAPKFTEKQPSILASRPCYRCISYMNSVGIKRVFWTTDLGDWECAKVRDLVDALDSLGQTESPGVAAALSNVFVTKHEVLMLRRTMGSDS